MSARYARLSPLDIDQQMVQDSTIAVVGLGATGSHMADNLARLGVNLVLIDRDYLEPANLSTSALYTEQHVESQLPKAVAAQQAVQDVNRNISINAHVSDVNRHTIEDLLGGVDIVMDGTDNMETRYLLNEYAVDAQTPWVHVSAIGHSGEVMPIIPDETACFHCIFADVDASGLETCETAGIRKETASTAANIATKTAGDIVQGRQTDGLIRFNLQQYGVRTLSAKPDRDCAVCQHSDFAYLSGEKGATTTALCGEHKYQVNLRNEQVDLQETASTLGQHGKVEQNSHLLRFQNQDTAFTLFTDGRAIIDADSTEQAKSVYARFIGN